MAKVKKTIATVCPKCQQKYLSEVEIEQADPVAVTEAKMAEDVGAKFSEEKAHLKEEIASLKEQIAELESPEHEDEVIRGWASLLDAPAFVRLAELRGFPFPWPEASAEEVARVEEETEEKVAVAATTKPVEKPSIVWEDPKDEAYRKAAWGDIWILRS